MSVVSNQIDIQTFCLTFALTDTHFRGELKHAGHVG